MADLYPNLRFPEIDFSSLGNLPQTIDEAKQRQSRQNLANLASEADTGSVEGLTKLAQKAYAQGLFTEGKDLLAQANVQRATAQRGLQDQLLIRALAGGGKNPFGLSGPPAPAAADSGPALTSTPAPAEGAPSVAPVPFLPGARSEAPQVPPQQAAEVPPSLNAPMKPTEQVLAAAEGAPSVAPQTRLAGPPPTPDTGAAPAVNPTVLPGMPAAAAPTLTPDMLPPAPAGVPPIGGSAAPRGPMPTTPPHPEESPALQYMLGNTLIGTLPPKGKNLPGFEVFMQKLKNEMQLQKVPEERQSWMLDNVQRKWAGEPELTQAQFKNSQEQFKGRDEDLRKAATTYNAGAEEGRALQNTLKPMLDIINNPDFVAGRDGSFGSMAGAMDTLHKGIKNLADGLGIPVPAGLTTPADLRDTFQALGNRAVIQALGGNLGRGINSAERVYMAQTIPSLMNSKDGSRVLLKVLDQASERATTAGNIANYYMQDYYKTTKGNASDLHLKVGDAMDKYNAAHGSILDEVPKGYGTSLKEQIGNIVSAGAASATPASAVAGAREAIGFAPPAPSGPPPAAGPSFGLPGRGSGPVNPIGVPGAPPPVGLDALLSGIGGRAEVPPVASQSEYMKANEGRKVTIAGEKYIVKDGRLQPLIEGE